jgi:TonB family protein
MASKGDQPRESRRPGRFRQWLLAADALPLSALIAVGAHAAVIVVAVNLRSGPEPERRQIVLARGWSPELESGQGPSHVQPGGDEPPILRPADPSDGARSIDLAAARRAFELPVEVMSPPVAPAPDAARFPAAGTSEMGTEPIAFADSSSGPIPASGREPRFASDAQGGGDAVATSAGDPAVESGSGPTMHSDQRASTSPGGRESARPGGSGGSSSPAGVPGGSIDASAVPIAYPPDALRKGWSGFVRARFDVDGRGRVVSIEIVERDPQSLFNDAVVEGLRRWRAPRFLWNTSGNVLPVVFKRPAER